MLKRARYGCWSYEFWSRIGSRDRMHRQGVEDIKGKTPLILAQPPKQPRRKLGKAELREHAAAGREALVEALRNVPLCNQCKLARSRY